MASPVTRGTFTRAETDRMFHAIATQAGGVNRLLKYRTPTPLDKQTVIRMNRDTLYSGAIVDTAGGARITIPKLPEGRYASVLVIDNDHYCPAVFYEPGTHTIPADTRYMFLGIRIQVIDPNDAAEIALINRLQDQFMIEAGSAEPLPAFGWDTDGLDRMRADLEEGARRYPSWEGGMGPRGQVDTEVHLHTTAAAWGLFPEDHATYLNHNGGEASDTCWVMTFTPPKHRAFWSITIYGKTGFIESEASNVNSSRAVLNADGTCTVHFGAGAKCQGQPNRVDTPEGWNFLMRIYRPDPSVLHGGYVIAPITPA